MLRLLFPSSSLSNHKQLKAGNRRAGKEGDTVSQSREQNQRHSSHSWDLENLTDLFYIKPVLVSKCAVMNISQKSKSMQSELSFNQKSCTCSTHHFQACQPSGYNSFYNTIPWGFYEEHSRALWANQAKSLLARASPQRLHYQSLNLSFPFLNSHSLSSFSTAYGIYRGSLNALTIYPLQRTNEATDFPLRKYPEEGYQHVTLQIQTYKSLKNSGSGISSYLNCYLTFHRDLYSNNFYLIIIIKFLKVAGIL